MPEKAQLLVFTDLDGTLLDHDTYAWEAARPALQRLAALRIPVILNSSKTLAEQARIRAELALPYPLAAENGQVLAVPADYFAGAGGDGPLLHEILGLPYAEITATAAALRARHGFRFRGFSELGDAQVAELCGFPVADAQRARQRLGTEPLHWQDDEDALMRFRALAAERGLQVVRGGRFVHLSGPADKGGVLRSLVSRFRAAWPDARHQTVALGDSDNDLPMLQCADHPIVIPRRRGPLLTVPDRPDARVAPAPGPAGWNLAMLSLLDELGYGQD